MFSPLAERKTGYLRESLNHQFDSALKIIEGKPVGMSQYVVSPERDFKIRHSGMFISGMERTDRGNSSEIHSRFVDSSFEFASRSLGSPRSSMIKKDAEEAVDEVKEENASENTEVEGSDDFSEDVEIKKKQGASGQLGSEENSLENTEKKGSEEETKHEEAPKQEEDAKEASKQEEDAKEAPKQEEDAKEALKQEEEDAKEAPKQEEEEAKEASKQEEEDAKSASEHEEEEAKDESENEEEAKSETQTEDEDSTESSAAAQEEEEANEEHSIEEDD